MYFIHTPILCICISSTKIINAKITDFAWRDNRKESVTSGSIIISNILFICRKYIFIANISSIKSVLFSAVIWSNHGRDVTVVKMVNNYNHFNVMKLLNKPSFDPL